MQQLVQVRARVQQQAREPDVPDIGQVRVREPPPVPDIGQVQLPVLALEPVQEREQQQAREPAQ